MIDTLSHIAHWVAVRQMFLLKAAVEVSIIFLFVYACLRILEGTRGAGVLKGLALVGVILIVVGVYITRRLGLENLSSAMSMLGPMVVIPMFILFQPEMRRALIRLGQNPLIRVFFRTQGGVAEEIVKAVFSMARDRIGALIAIEREVGLKAIVEAGVRLDAEVSAELLKTIFWPGTPLHDGAVVIRQQRIAAAGCLFPLTDNPQFSRELGTRHRAAVGLTEESDAVAIVVSEQTGQVSLAFAGTLKRDLDEKALLSALEELTAESRQ